MRWLLETSEEWNGIGDVGLTNTVKDSSRRSGVCERALRTLV